MEDYEHWRKIGDGTFGTVYLCRKRSKGSNIGAEDSSEPFYAIKKMKKRYYNWSDCMRLREVRALKKMKHRNIVLLREVIRKDNQLYLVFEHMEKNLHQLIRDRPVPFPEATIVNITAQIAEGLAYIHRQGFFHRDIKPENLLCRNGPEEIKIADFGLTREIDSLPPYTEYVSTRWYRAPELLLRSKEYTWSVDVWALGCITAELYTLQPLFPGRSEIDQIYKICQVLGAPSTCTWPEGHRLASSIRFDFPNIVPIDIRQAITDCSPSGLDFIKSLLVWIPENRPSATDILRHEFLR